MFINLHDRSLISTPITIIRSTEYGDQLLVVSPIVPFHHQLMSSANQRKSIGVIKLLSNVLSKRVTGSFWYDPPTTTIVGVSPQQIAHRTFMRNFDESIKLQYVVQSIDLRR